MIGMIDIGGGLRGIYTSGLFDYLLDNDIMVDYCFGVSSGSANILGYVAKQRGMSREFYLEHSFESEFLGAKALIKSGDLVNVEYIYNGLIDCKGENSDAFDIAMANECRYTCVATDSVTAKPRYFTKDDFSRDNLDVLKAACSLPVATRPVKIGDRKYFDGGVSDPIPIRKAFADGCDKVIVCITQPRDFRKTKIHWLANVLLANHPRILNNILVMHNYYNNGISELLELEKEGKVLVVDPRECFGVNTIKRDKVGMEKLYQLGYSDGKRIEEFVKAARAEEAAKAQVK